jgi:hypothetical protein
MAGMQDAFEHDDITARSRHRRTTARLGVVALALVMVLSACKLSDITDPVVGLFGLGKNEVATPQFRITDGIKIQVVLHAPEGSSGTPITVHVRCSGGTDLSSTITVKDSGDVSLGQTTFTQGWPAGADCLVSQETVQGIDVASAAIQNIGNVIQANFINR